MSSDCIKNIINQLQKNEKFKANFAAVELFEVFNCYDPAQFISICLSALGSVINLQLPHVNVIMMKVA
jgi:Conserved hypothetical ATP binding protein.